MPLAIKAELEINGELHARNIDEDSRIGDNLELEFMEQANIYAWWATMVELARDKVLRQKALLDQLAAKIDHRERMKAKAANEQAGKTVVKLTEKMVENTVITDPEFIAAQTLYFECKKQLGMLDAGKQAMDTKRYMLVAIGANMRAEGMANPTVMKDAARERLRRSQVEMANEMANEEVKSAPKKKFPGKRN